MHSSNYSENHRIPDTVPTSQAFQVKDSNGYKIPGYGPDGVNNNAKPNG